MCSRDKTCSLLHFCYCHDNSPELACFRMTQPWPNCQRGPNQQPPDHNASKRVSQDQKNHPVKPSINSWPIDFWAKEILIVLNNWILGWFVTQHRCVNKSLIVGFPSFTTKESKNNITFMGSHICLNFSHYIILHAIFSNGFLRSCIFLSNSTVQ